MEWLAFVNDIKVFNVIDCFSKYSMCHWRKYSFAKDDVVYLYVKSRQRVIYKTRVISDNVIAANWEDDEFWINPKENTNKGNRVILRLEKVYNGVDLSVDYLMKNGLKTTQSLSRPNKNPLSLIAYIKSCFDKE